MYRQPFPPHITADHQGGLEIGGRIGEDWEGVQGGLEIACKVSVKMTGTIKNLEYILS